MKTRGGINIKDIKIGDIHYEFDYGCGVKMEVISLPQYEDELWKWKSKLIEGSTVNKSPFTINEGSIQEYMVCEGASHYGPNLYSYDAYGMFENRMKTIDETKSINYIET